MLKNSETCNQVCTWITGNCYEKLGETGSTFTFILNWPTVWRRHSGQRDHEYNGEEKWPGNNSLVKKVLGLWNWLPEDMILSPDMDTLTKNFYNYYNAASN